MTVRGYKMSLRSKLESGKFIVTTEVGPPKGTDTTRVKELIELIKGKVDAANVTDQQSSTMRLGPLVVADMLVRHGVEPVYQMTCRDRNRIALQSDLLSAWVMGVKNVLALTGDSLSLGDHPEAKPVFDLDSVTLLHAISRLNEGYDLAGKALKGKPNIFPGATVKVAADTEASLELQLIKMERKVNAGAKFFQTQAVYHVEDFAKFMERAGQFNVPIIVGVVPLKSASMGRFLNEKVPGVFVPDAMIKQMAESADKIQTGIQICADLIKQLKGLCQGVHIMAIGWEKKVPAIIEAAGL